MFKLIREFIGDGLVIVFGVFSLRFLFVPILLGGEVTLCEPNTLILWLEIVVAGLFILLGLERFVDDLHKIPRRK